MDQEGEEKGIKLKENQEGKAGKKLWRRKTSVSRRKRRRRRQRKSRKMPLERKKMPRERMDKKVLADQKRYCLKSTTIFGYFEKVFRSRNVENVRDLFIKIV